MMKLTTLFILAVGLVVGCMPAAKSSALSGSDFQAGRIIDDTLFFAPNNMTASDIQAFLSAKVPTCDTNGTESSSHWDSQDGRYYTHAEWGTLNGYPPPFICLKDYTTTTVAKSTEANLCNGYTSTNQTAAQIIYGVAQSCGVSPKVLIVLLQKEQGLVTDDWPWSIEYRSATGYGCPDTAACDSQYYGFFNQVYSAARQYKLYARSPDLFNYTAYQNNFILYNPDSSCGGSNVFVQNQSTAGLYNYTPYQPNPGALATVSDSSPGGTATCGAYGNRNFWWYYNAWFGSTSDPFDNASIRLSSPLTINPASPLQGQTYTASFGITNSASFPINIGSVFVSVRGPQGQNLDTPADNNVTIPANSTYTYSKQWFTPLTGQHTFNIALCKSGLGCSLSAPAGTTPSVVRSTTINVTPNPHVTSSLSISPAQPAVGQTYTATFNIRNDSSQPVDIGYPFVIVRGPQGQNRDTPADTHVVIPANSTYSYSKQWLATETGPYSFTMATYIPGQGILTNYPVADSGVNKTLTTTILDNPTLTGSLTLNPAQPVQGSPYAASFTITNKASYDIKLDAAFIVVRGPQGQNLDTPADSNITIPAGGTYTYSKQWFTPFSGQHQFSIVTYRQASGFSFTYPASASSSVVRSLTASVQPNPHITSIISLSPVQPKVGQSYTATFTVRNDSSQPVDIGYPFIIVRGPQGQNRDMPISDHVIIPANSTYTYTKQWLVTEAGTNTFTIATYIPGQGITTSWPVMDSGLSRTISVQATN